MYVRLRTLYNLYELNDWNFVLQILPVVKEKQDEKQDLIKHSMDPLYFKKIE